MVTCGTPPIPPLYLEQEQHNLEYQKGQKKKVAISPFQNKLRHPSSTSQTTRNIAERFVTAPSTGGGASASFRVLLLTSEPLPLWLPSCVCARKLHCLAGSIKEEAKPSIRIKTGCTFSSFSSCMQVWLVVTGGGREGGGVGEW